MRNEIWENGQLIEVIETDDEVFDIETPTLEQNYAITTTAIATLDAALNDPSINSINELKSALKNFINEIQNPEQN